jgi:hypothetical protein
MRKLSVIILFFATASQILASTVLWDASHGEYGYVPSNWFRKLSQHLRNYGFTIDTTYKGFLTDNPDSYDIAVVCAGSSVYSAYTADEVAKIKDFVNKGGGLLIMGEMVQNQNIQPVASDFGVTLGVSEVGYSPYTIYTSDFAPSPLFNGVSQICFQSVGELATSGSLEEVVWCQDRGITKALAVAGEWGNGRVVVLGDINIFSSFNGSGEYYDRADNRQFSVNTFEYLVPEPTTICLLSLGALSLIRRKRRV